MNVCVIIPVHNEEDFIGQTISSLLAQTQPPDQIIIVDDNSTDNSGAIIKQFEEKHQNLSYVFHESRPEHQPGGKIVNAFLKGLGAAEWNFDILCKFDADLIFPSNYIETMVNQYSNRPELGMFGGICVVEKNGSWVKERVTGSHHIRGALKSYRKGCYDDFGGLKPVFGWDTIDELLAEFNGWSYLIDDTLEVKHLKPTASRYGRNNGLSHGQVLYGMRMGKTLTVIRALIHAIRKRNFSLFSKVLKGYKRAEKRSDPYLVSEAEGEFIRTRQWRIFKKKLLRI